MVETRAIYKLDAFAEAPFSGNPAAVVPLDAWPEETLLQAIAMENNLSETAYFVPTPDDPDHDYRLRWFTPRIEVDLCGHATLATAAVLFDRLGFAGDRLRFASNSGTLTVARAEQGRFALDLPAMPGEAGPPPAGLSERLGGVPVTGFVAGTFELALLPDEVAVRTARPDLRAIETAHPRGLVITAPGDTCDVVSRFFAPHSGNDEDPVTGSVHCTIAPYWAGQVGRNRLHCRQLSRRGGDLYCTLADGRVRIEGAARFYLEGTIDV